MDEDMEEERRRQQRSQSAWDLFNDQGGDHSAVTDDRSRSRGRVGAAHGESSGERERGRSTQRRPNYMEDDNTGGSDEAPDVSSHQTRPRRKPAPEERPPANAHAHTHTHAVPAPHPQIPKTPKTPKTRERSDLESRSSRESTSSEDELRITADGVGGVGIEEAGAYPGYGRYVCLCGCG
ncbi:hypothetical protein BDP27DRAFT_1423181 [Rhodocollybia butyracea]|uniref:Uncharacterized protein n=1 Tax=Rhodocollybia butyracea TaxID=206335 RepID=A0A9P5PSH1_9AGAR|nr:hypothetical protein BDP27DRAFT_1423181 [Rhodocollybia butyracea]